MASNSKPYTLDRVVRMALGAGALWAGVKLLAYLSDALLPFAAALLLAYLINPLVSAVHRKIKNRSLAVVLTLTGLLALCWAATMLVFPLMGQEISHMAQAASNLLSDSELAKRAAARLPPDLWTWLKNFMGQQQVKDFFASKDFALAAREVLGKLLPGAWGVATGVLDLAMAVLGLVIVLLYIIFLLLDFQRIKKKWPEIFPESAREQIQGFVAEFEAAMSRYFRAQFVVAMLVGVLFATGFSIIGLPMAILLGLGLGLMNMVPYLQLAGLVPAVLLSMFNALETGQSFAVAILLVLLVVGAVQLIQDAVLVPRIMGEAMGLTPWLILLSLSVWGKLLGLFGLIIALPATCLVLAWYRRYLATGQIDFTRRPEGEAEVP
jgi:predicted PurR-regulated permease PerM